MLRWRQYRKIGIPREPLLLGMRQYPFREEHSGAGGRTPFFGSVEPPATLRYGARVDRFAINLGGTAEDAFRPNQGQVASFFVFV